MSSTFNRAFFDQNNNDILGRILGYLNGEDVLNFCTINKTMVNLVKSDVTLAIHVKFKFACDSFAKKEGKSCLSALDVLKLSCEIGDLKRLKVCLNDEETLIQQNEWKKTQCYFLCPNCIRRPYTFDPLQIAIENNRLNVVRYFVEREKSPTNDEILFAARINRLEVVKLLHEGHKTYNGINAKIAQSAIKNDNLEMLKFIMQNSSSDIFKEDIFKYLCYKDFNWKGENLKEILTYLYSLGYKVNLRH